MKKFKLKTGPDFSFRHTLSSHGWSDLSPFDHEEGSGVFTYTYVEAGGGPAITVKVTETPDGMRVSADQAADRREAVRVVAHVLRLDEDFSEFYQAALQTPGTRWAALSKAGRLLRSATVWEDLVKTLCTTNCSWALTKKMVSNLVETLGDESESGHKAFPTAAAMAEQSPKFYRDTIRAGYRSEYFAEVANAVAKGDVDPEAWLDRSIPTAELRKEIKSLKGIGDYAADNLLKLLGRYDGLALDSWLRSGFYKKHKRGRKCSDAVIKKHYDKFGDWRGLAIWCDMTEAWFEQK